VGVDLLDLVFRLERTFCIRIGRDEFLQLIEGGKTADIRVGRLFDYVHAKAVHSSVFDEDLDTELIWAMFRRALSDSLGIEAEELTKDKGLIHDLGAA
jgi:hypothetical protein